jgi:hypothetical protein
MQTFLPYKSFKKTAKILDYRRLGKQRVECLQILQTLAKGSRWKNHPAVLMWSGYEQYLIRYGQEICLEWRRRNYKDTCLEKISSFKSVFKDSIEKPWWLGKRKFHLSHKSNLIRKFPEYYQKHFKNVSSELPYFWPSENENKQKEKKFKNFKNEIIFF